MIFIERGEKKARGVSFSPHPTWSKCNSYFIQFGEWNHLTSIYLYIYICILGTNRYHFVEWFNGAFNSIHLKCIINIVNIIRTFFETLYFFFLFFDAYTFAYTTCVGQRELEILKNERNYIFYLDTVSVLFLAMMRTWTEFVECHQVRFVY